MRVSQRLVAMAVSAVLMATGSLAVAGPASADDAKIYVSQLDINLGFTILGTSYGGLGTGETYTWYLCDTRTSFVSTRADFFEAWPPASDSAVTTELSNNGCEAVPAATGYSVGYENFYENGGLFKTPIKPYIAFTTLVEDTAYPEKVLAVSQGAMLRTLDSLPTVSKSGTTYTATDGVWGGGLGAPDANSYPPFGYYLACDSAFSPAGAAYITEELAFPGNILFACSALYSNAYYDGENGYWVGDAVTDLTLSESATVYRNLPTGGPDDTPVPYDLSGKYLVRFVMAYPFAAWSCSQPCPTQSAEVTVTPSPASPSITYGASTPTLTPSYSGYSGSDTAAAAPTCTVYEQGTSTEVTASPIPVGTYDTQCSGGDAGTNYQFTYAKGSLTVSKLTPTVTYTGGTSAIPGDSLTLSSTISSGSCTGTITYALSKNPLTGVAGDYPLGSSPVSTTGWVPGTYTVTASYPGDANCSTASATGSLVVGASQEVEGNGTYTSPQGVATFGFEIEDPREHGGNPDPSKMTWTVVGKWKFTGLLSMNWTQNAGTGTTTGTGTLYKWLKVGSTYKWVSQGSNVATTIKFTQTTRKVGSTPASPGSFAIGFTGAGFPSLPANTAPLTKGSIKYETESLYSVPK